MRYFRAQAGVHFGAVRLYSRLRTAQGSSMAAIPPPDAFLSYTRFDDQHHSGAISKLCRRLASAVRAVTGTPFNIFQDIDGIGIGEHWPGKLDQMLDQARFFIPILTPSYFKSMPCREELEKFLRAEADRGRNDLVLPIYYIECNLLEDDGLRAGDVLARTLHERQWQDWRKLRHSSFTTKMVKNALDELAREIDRARRRLMLGRTDFHGRGRPVSRGSPKTPSLKPLTSTSELPATLTWSQALHWLTLGKLDEGDLELKLALEEAYSQQTSEPAPPQRLSVEQARRILLDLLESGRAVATGRRVSAIGAAALQEQSLSSDIPAGGWPDLKIDDASSFAHLAHASVSGQGYAEVRIKRQDVLTALRGALSKAPQTTLNADKQLSLESTRSLLKPGTIFCDLNGPWCPEMVVIPPGEFLMGEEPQRLVRIGYPFAVGRYPVTFQEYDHFAAATRRGLPYDHGWGRGRRPVIYVSWDDAQAYVKWLSGETGRNYRLLSEAEWEYACRAGSTTRYWWGEKITRENANYHGTWMNMTTEVGRYPSNAFALSDMHGNVWEWCADHCHATHQGAPADGSAWLEANLAERVMRGGSWMDRRSRLCASCRTCAPASNRSYALGFRIARDLP